MWRMSKRKFNVLYTHQKVKKKKVWQDGFLTLAIDKKVGFLLDENGKQLSTVYLHRKEIENGVDLESDKYLIQVEDEVLGKDLLQQSKLNIQDSSPQVEEFTNACPVPAQCSFRKSRTKFNVPRRAEPKLDQVPKPSNTLKEQENTINEVTIDNIWCSVRSGNVSSVPPILPEKRKFSAAIDSSSGGTNRDTSQLLELLEANTSNKDMPSTFGSAGENISLKSSANGNEVDLEFPSFLDEDFSFKNKESTSEQTGKLVLRQPWKKPRLSDDHKLAASVNDDKNVVNFPKTMQEKLSKKILFPPKEEVFLFLPKHSIVLPDTFTSIEDYVTCWRNVINEHLSIQLWKKLRSFFTLMQNADIDMLLSLHCDRSDAASEELPFLPEVSSSNENDLYEASANPPCCDHEIPCKTVRVRKQGPNTGRLFYSCCKGKARRCKFFKWVDEHTRSLSTLKLEAPTCGKIKIRNERALISYLKRNGIIFYTGCSISRKSGVPEEAKVDASFLCAKRQIILTFSQQDRSLNNIKDDLWIISKSFDFDSSDSLVVKVLSNCVSSSGGVAIQPLNSYSINEWESEDIERKINVLMVSKSSLEFQMFQVLEKQLKSLPLVTYLLSGECSRKKHSTKATLSSIFSLAESAPNTEQSYFKPTVTIKLDYNDLLTMARQYGDEYKLNDDQSTTLSTVVDMMKDRGKSVPPIVIIDGVPGSGKTYVLSVLLILLFDVMTQSIQQSEMENSENVSGHKQHKIKKWKVLITSDTDAKVDGLLRCLLKLGFEKIARVGSLDRINSSLLPYSVHNKGGSDEQLKKLKVMLRQCGHSDPEKHYINKSIEEVERGATKRLLHNAFVVGTTCNGALSPSIGYYKFPIIVIDGACSVSEPLALQPLARFSSEKLILAGDYNNTIDSCVGHYMKKSLFQRLQDCGHDSILLHTQYRYHPDVTAVLNKLYYHGKIVDEHSVTDIPPLLAKLPNVCVYDVPGKEELKNPNDFYNCEEAKFVADIIALLLNHGVPGASIAIITNYDAQVSEIKSELQDIGLYDMSDVRCIAVSTQANYSLEERQVLIYSSVHSPPISTAETDRQIKSFLTQARNHTLIVGNVAKLSLNNNWKMVIDILKQRRNGVQTSFQFRKFFQRNRNCGECFINSDAPFRVQNMGGDVRQQQPNSDKSEKDYTPSLEHVDETSPTLDFRSLDEDDELVDIPTLCHKRKRLLIEDDDDSDSYDATS